MSKRSQSKKGLPNESVIAIKALGNNVRLARKRRRLSQKDMASRMFVTQKTLSRLEAGEPGVSLSVVFSALHVLGLTDSARVIADPQQDKLGQWLEQRELPKRVRSDSTRSDPDMDF